MARSFEGPGIKCIFRDTVFVVEKKSLSETFIHLTNNLSSLLHEIVEGAFSRFVKCPCTWLNWNDAHPGALGSSTVALWSAAVLFPDFREVGKSVLYLPQRSGTREEIGRAGEECLGDSGLFLKPAHSGRTQNGRCNGGTSGHV